MVRSAEALELGKLGVLELDQPLGLLTPSCNRSFPQPKVAIQWQFNMVRALWHALVSHRSHG
jgi:hypothetical protein